MPDFSFLAPLNADLAGFQSVDIQSLITVSARDQIIIIFMVERSSQPRFDPPKEEISELSLKGLSSSDNSSHSYGEFHPLAPHHDFIAWLYDEMVE